MSRREFIPRVDVLPQAQQLLWTELEETPDSFVLYGGTGLALQLGHCQSEYFDFFSSEPFLPDELLRGVRYSTGAVVLDGRQNTLTCSLERNQGQVKISFFGNLALRRVEDPLRPKGMRLHVASRLDIAASKMGVIQRRAFAKDYIDIAALLDAGVSLEQALGAARAVYGRAFDPLVSLKAPAYYGDGSLQSVPEQVQRRLSNEAKKIELASIPLLTGHAGLAGGKCL